MDLRDLWVLLLSSSCKDHEAIYIIIVNTLYFVWLGLGLRLGNIDPQNLMGFLLRDSLYEKTTFSLETCGYSTLFSAIQHVYTQLQFCACSEVIMIVPFK